MANTLSDRTELYLVIVIERDVGNRIGKGYTGLYNVAVIKRISTKLMTAYMSLFEVRMLRGLARESRLERKCTLVERKTRSSKGKSSIFERKLSTFGEWMIDSCIERLQAM